MKKTESSIRELWDLWSFNQNVRFSKVEFKLSQNWNRKGNGLLEFYVAPCDLINPEGLAADSRSHER